MDAKGEFDFWLLHSAEFMSLEFGIVPLDTDVIMERV